MKMSLSNFFPKKASSPFNVRDFYLEWYETLTREYLPLLTSAASATCTVSDDEITAMLNHVFGHLVSYYETLERSADHNTISHLFSTSWLYSMETPFLFLGDIHPYIFTNLLRSFINPAIQDSSDIAIELDRRFEFVNAWQDPSEELETKTSKIELRSTMNVPALLERVRIIERNYVARVSQYWIFSHQEKRKKKTTKMVDEDLSHLTNEEMDALLEIFVETNRLRTSVIRTIRQTLSLYQSTMYLEALCQILVGLNNQVYNDCEKYSHPYSSIRTQQASSKTDSDKRDNKVLQSNFVNGVTAVPSFFLLMGKMTKVEIKTLAWTFVARMVSAATSTFVSAMLKRRGLCRSGKDALWALLCFLMGGIIPILFGVLIPSRLHKIIVTVVLTGLLIGVVIIWDFVTREDKKERQTNAWVLWIVTLVAIGAAVGLADIVNHLSH